MLIIKYLNVTARYECDGPKWVGSDDRDGKRSKVVLSLLNNHLPVHHVDSIYRQSQVNKKVTGLDAEALDALKDLDGVEIVHYEEQIFNIPDDAVV